MNKYLENLNRIEFVVTMACTGRCIHCSEGEHKSSGKHIDGDIVAQAVIDICNNYDIKSLMTFVGEPLIYPEVVCNIHKTAKEVCQRQSFRCLLSLERELISRGCKSFYAYLQKHRYPMV